MNISNEDAVLFERLASRVLGAEGSLRAPADVLAANELGQSSLWAHGISGDLPILLVRVVDEELGIVRQALEAQEYWRLRDCAPTSYPKRASGSYMDESVAPGRATRQGPWRMGSTSLGGSCSRGTRWARPSDLFMAVANAILDTSPATCG